MFTDEPDWLRAQMTQADTTERKAFEAAFPLFPHVDFDFTIATDRCPVGLSARYPNEFNRRVAGGAVSYLMQLTSVDYALKRYLKDVSYPQASDERLDLEISNCVDRLVATVESRMRAFSRPDEGAIGTIMADVTLGRLRATFSAALTLANRGFLFEVAALSRMALEQIAWANHCFGHEDCDYVSEVSASKAITHLKPVYPTVGMFYGWLSSHLHWDYEAHVGVLGEKDGFLSSTLASCEFKATALAIILIVLDCYLACFEWLYREALSEFYVLNSSLEQSVFKSERQTTELLHKVLAAMGNDPVAAKLSQFAKL